MTHVETQGPVRSRPNRQSPMDYDPKIIEAQKTRGTVARRECDARLIGM